MVQAGNREGGQVRNRLTRALAPGKPSSRGHQHVVTVLFVILSAAKNLSSLFSLRFFSVHPRLLRYRIPLVNRSRAGLLFFCLAALLLAALLPGLVALPFALFAPIWFFVAAVVLFSLARHDELRPVLQSVVLPAFSPRPPPSR